MAGMGIKAKNLKVTDDAIRTIIQDYTAESGVRGLKKQMNTLCRYAAVKLVKGEQKSITVNPKRLREFLNQKPIHHESILEEKQPGVVTGLAWTSAGGEILFIEAMFTKGSGKIQVTGQLGDVMKESVQIAVSLVKSMYPESAAMWKKMICISTFRPCSTKGRPICRHNTDNGVGVIGDRQSGQSSICDDRRSFITWRGNADRRSSRETYGSAESRCVEGIYTI